MQKWKVVKEYSRFYLCESEKGHTECFQKTDYTPNKEGYILKKENEDNYVGGNGLPPEKVNRSFNHSKFSRKD